MNEVNRLMTGRKRNECIYNFFSIALFFPLFWLLVRSPIVFFYGHFVRTINSRMRALYFARNKTIL